MAIRKWHFTFVGTTVPISQFILHMATWPRSTYVDVAGYPPGDEHPAIHGYVEFEQGHSFRSLQGLAPALHVHWTPSRGSAAAAKLYIRARKLRELAVDRSDAE